MHKIITDLGAIDVTSHGLVLRELAPGVTIAEIQEATEPALAVPVPPAVMDIPAGV